MNPCSICTHPKRLSIDQEIVSGRSLRSIAAMFNVSYDSLYRHAKDHLTRQLTKAWEIKSMNEDNKLLQKIDSIIERAEDIFQRNYEAGKDLTALKSLTEIRGTIELLSKISYQSLQSQLAQVELERQRKLDEQGSDGWNYMESLSILTDAELNLFGQLLRKLKTGNKNKIIRKTPQNFSFDDFSDLLDGQEGESAPERIEMSQNKKIRMVRTR